MFEMSAHDVYDRGLCHGMCYIISSSEVNTKVHPEGSSCYG